MVQNANRVLQNINLVLQNTIWVLQNTIRALQNAIWVLQNQELAQLRDWLLPMLMNGQVSVEDVQDEVLAMVAEPAEDYTKTVNLNKEKSIEDRFQLWLSNQKLAARGGINETVLREIFDVMDDEDK